MPGHPRGTCADTSFLVHTLPADALPLLVHMHTVSITEHVLDEVTIPWEVEALDEAVQAGHIEVLKLTERRELLMFASLRQRMGDGEAAAITAAACRDLLLATDDREPPVARAIDAHLRGDVLSFQGLLRDAIERGLLSVQDADSIKDALADEHAYRMPVRTFADVVRRPLS